MQMWIYRNDQSLGSFEESEVVSNLRNGSFFPTDVGCRVGEDQRQPLSSLFPQAILQPSHQTFRRSRINVKAIVLSVLGTILLILGIGLLVWSKVPMANFKQQMVMSGEFGRAQEASSAMSALDTFGYVIGVIGLVILVVGLLQKKPDR